MLCLLSAYGLINYDFVFLYAAFFIYTALAAWGSSVNWLKNGFVSLSALCFMLAIGEVVLSFAEPLESSREAVRYTKGYSQPLRENGGELGYRPYPERKVRAWKNFGNERLYDVVYTINADGYRETPGFSGIGESTAPIVFYGGSFAFGEGLNDDGTFPYFVAAGTNWSRPVLNLAFFGYGPHQMLRSIELGKLDDLGYETVKTAVYEAIPDHPRRAAGESWWDPVGPKYALDESGVAQYQGRFTDIADDHIEIYYRYLQFVELARRSRVVGWTANLLFGAGTGNPRENVQLMVEIVAKSAAILKKDYQANFVVLFWDYEPEKSSLILEGLAEKNIRTIKVSDFIPHSELHLYRMPNSLHPTSAANKLLAERLIPYLEVRD